MSCRCDICGKFTKDENIISIQYDDGCFGVDECMECRDCISIADEDRYFKDGKRGNQ